MFLVIVLGTETIIKKKRNFTDGFKLTHSSRLGLIFAGYVPLASQSPYPIIVYSVANYSPNLSHLWAKT